MRVRPAPSAQRLKIRRTMAASSALIRRVTCDRSPVAVQHLDVVVPEHAAPSDVARSGLAKHRIVGPLPRLLALELVGESGQRQHDFVGWAVECALAVLEVEEHPNARLDDLFQGVGRLDGLSAKSRLFGHDEHMERRPRFQRVHEPEKRGPVRKLGAADGPARPANQVLRSRPMPIAHLRVLPKGSRTALLAPRPVIHLGWLHERAGATRRLQRAALSSVRRSRLHAPIPDAAMGAADLAALAQAHVSVSRVRPSIVARTVAGAASGIASPLGKCRPRPLNALPGARP